MWHNCNTHINILVTTVLHTFAVVV